MTHEDFVSFEQAKKLCNLGFDLKCIACYDEGEFEITSEYPTNYNSGRYRYNLISAPTLSQAQKWLREVKETEVIVIRIDEDIYSYIIYGELVNVSSKTHFNFYEQALSAGIDKAFKLLKSL